MQRDRSRTPDETTAEEAQAWSTATWPNAPAHLWLHAVELRAIKKGARPEELRAPHVKERLSRWRQAGEPVWMAADGIAFMVTERRRARTRDDTLPPMARVPSHTRSATRRDPPRLRLLPGGAGASAPVETRAELLQRRSREMEEETRRHTGSGWVKGRDVTAIAKLVRQDIADAVRRGALPAAKYAIRTKRYSGGRELRVTISDVRIPGAILLKVYNESRLRREMQGKDGSHDEQGRAVPFYSEPARQLLQRVEDIVEQYNKSATHGQSDYYENEFFGAVEFDHRWTDAIRERQIARLREAISVGRDGPRRATSNRSRTRSSRDPQRVAETILAQLGGRRFLVMTGAKASSDRNTLILKLPRGARNSIKAVVITLEPSDTYSMRFVKQARDGTVTTVRQLDQVYAEDLQRIFTDVTGLETSLGTLGRDRSRRGRS